MREQRIVPQLGKLATHSAAVAAGFSLRNVVERACGITVSAQAKACGYGKMSQADTLPEPLPGCKTQDIGHLY